MHLRRAALLPMLLLAALLVPAGPAGPATAVAPDAPGAPGALGATGGTAHPAHPAQRRAAVPLLPVDAAWDYQIGGARTPARGVRVVVRDREAPSAGRYDVCYVNAFQTQPGERSWWSAPERRDLLLQRDGEPVVDAGWGEVLLDTSTAAKRARLADVVGAWLAGCARDGYEAVELDNLDSFLRSGGLLSPADNLALARLLNDRAHALGMASAQKNFAEAGVRGPRAGFDLAVAESCQRWRECGAYQRRYPGRVLAVEYDRRSYRAACRAWGDRLGVTLRDRAVAPAGPRRTC